MIRPRRSHVTHAVDELLAGRPPAHESRPEAAALLDVARKISLDDRERLSREALARGRQRVLSAISSKPHRAGWWPPSLRALALTGGVLALLSGATIAAAQVAPPGSPFVPVRQVTRQIASAIPFLRDAVRPASSQSGKSTGSLQQSTLLLAQPRGGAAPANSAISSRQGGTTPGNSANAPGHGGTSPGNSANAPGHGGTSPGNSAIAPGHSGISPGNSTNAPGHSGTAPANSVSAPVQGGTSPGKSANAPGHASTTKK